MSQADEIQTLTDFIPHLLQHIEDRDMQLTSSGIQLTPDWDGWAVTAHCLDADDNEELLSYTTEDAKGFLEEITA